MTKKIELPDWIIKATGRAAHMFFLNAWKITAQPIQSQENPARNEDNNGLAKFNTQYLTATLFFDPALEPDEEGQEVVFHEVLHLVFGPMRDAVSHIVGCTSGLDEDRDRLMALYDGTEEQLITVLVRGMIQDFDTTSWLAKGELIKETEEKPQ